MKTTDTVLTPDKVLPTRENLIGCWIDGGLPRSTIERIQALCQLAYYVSHDIDVFLYLSDYNLDDETTFDEIEYKLIEFIQDHLPDDLYIIQNTGDIMITDETEE